MISPSIDICWTLAEAEASQACFAAIEPAHFWIGLCKVVDLPLPDLLDAATPQMQALSGKIEADVAEVRNVFLAAAVEAKALRRAIRAGLGRQNHQAERPLHRTQRLREVFKRAGKLARGRGGGVRPAHLLQILGQDRDTVVVAAMVRLGLDADGVFFRLNDHFGAAAASPAAKPEDQQANAGQPAEAPEAGGKPSALKRFGRDLTELAKAGALPPLIGRRKELLRITQVLRQSRKNNLILVGEPGVGKTGIVEGFAQLMAAGELPEALGRPAIIEISLPALVAGTRYRGEFEQRLESVIREASQDSKPILFIDEIHLLLGAGQAGGSMDAANILKPALARGTIRVIGATTIQDYRQTIEKDGALERRFQMLHVEEPTPAEAEVILLALRPRLEEHHGVCLDEAALKAAVEWSVRYLPDFRLPDKALDLVDQACAAARFQTLTPQGKLKHKGGTGGLPVLEKESPAGRPCPSSSTLNIGREEIARAVAARCGIPVGDLTSGEEARLVAMDEHLAARVKGQPEAIAAVAAAVRLARAGLKKPERPVGVFLFVGPSGTGKTELAKALAEFLFRDERRLIRFDMSEFMEEHSVAKLIGSPPGYVGHDEGGQLTDAIRTNPYSVVLFDEVEKAHPRILDLFLQIFDEGTLTDGKGRNCSFREAVIILTSNLGTAAPGAKIGFGPSAGSAPDDDKNDHILNAVRRHLRPELLNRLTKVIAFKPLAASTVREIIDKILAGLNQRLADKQVTVTLDASAYDLLMAEGFSEEFGARHMERVVDHLLAMPMAEDLLSGKIKAGQMIRAEVNGNQFQFHSTP